MLKTNLSEHKKIWGELPLNFPVATSLVGENLCSHTGYLSQCAG